ncbi:hypothetical protein [Microbacterium sp. NPDC091662]|uniref:hypothetical protein n=1 Tax=Microbacterium sp. NPDC091662 TaxID=3364211 RepID=UPI00382B528E
MDVFERVREVNRGAGLTEERITAARARLLIGIDEGRSAERKRITRRPMFVIAGAVAGVAAATAGVVVVNQLTAPNPRVEAVRPETVRPTPQTSPTPQAAPTSGASVTEPFPGTTPEAGQYLKIVTTDDRLLYLDPATSIYQWWFRPEEHQPTTAAVLRERHELYVPGDRTGEWISQFGPSNEKTWLYPESQDSLRLWNNVAPYRAEIYESSYVGGFGDGEMPIPGSAQWYAQYPDDPGQLIQFFRDKFASGAAEPERAEELMLNALSEELMANYAPAQTRKTLLQALELTGRAEKISVSAGVIIYRIHYSVMSIPTTTTISIDAETGWVTEFTSRVDRGGNEDGIVPANIPDIRKTFTVSIVDSLP